MKIKVKQKIYKKNIEADYQGSDSIINDIVFTKEVNIIKIDCFDGIVNWCEKDEDGNHIYTMINERICNIFYTDNNIISV